VRRSVFFLALLAIVVGCGSGVQERTNFVVIGMHCDACSGAITEALQGVEGVSRAWADHEKGVAEAVFSPKKVSAETLKDTIEVLGYTVTGFSTVSATAASS